jgi:hypothetical protein
MKEPPMRTFSITSCCLTILLMIGCSENKPQPQPVSLNDLPQSIKEGFARDFPNVQIQSVERIPKKGVDFYRLHYIGQDGKKKDILYNPEGFRDTKQYQRRQDNQQQTSPSEASQQPGVSQ